VPFLKDAPLLILDEATSNLDPEHEAALQATLEGLMQGRTVLVMSPGPVETRRLL